MSKNGETAGLDFLDFLFTVAISAGLTPEVLQIAGVTGLLSEGWQREGRIPSRDEWFNIGVFALGIFNLTLSWFGYHASIKSRPLNYYSSYGMVRFIIDVLLVIMYGVVLIKYRSFHVVLVSLILVYAIFVVWDYLKICEYWEPPANAAEAQKKNYFSVKLDKTREKFPSGPSYKINLQAYRREFVSLFCALLFVLLGLLYFFANRWIVLACAIIITVFYRFNKNYVTWEWLFGVKDA